MRFDWDDGTVTYGHAVDNAGPDEDQYGIQFDLPDDSGIAAIGIGLPRLRQMVAEAEAFAEQEQLANCDCANCDCQTYAPLATEQELIEEAEDRKTQEILEIERLLNQAEAQAVNATDYLNIARIRKDLLG